MTHLRGRHYPGSNAQLRAELDRVSLAKWEQHNITKDALHRLARAHATLRRLGKRLREDRRAFKRLRSAFRVATEQTRSVQEDYGNLLRDALPIVAAAEAVTKRVRWVPSSQCHPWPNGNAPGPGNQLRDALDAAPPALLRLARGETDYGSGGGEPCDPGSTGYRAGEEPPPSAAAISDLRCATCGHSPESHHAGTGQCYTCPAEARCTAYVQKAAAQPSPSPEPEPKRCGTCRHWQQWVEPTCVGYCKWKGHGGLAVGPVTSAPSGWKCPDYQAREERDDEQE